MASKLNQKKMLYSIPKKRFSFLKGVGSLLEVVSSHDNRITKLYRQSDSNALKSDWRNIGKDIDVALKKTCK